MNFGELLSFRKMITPTIIQIIYFIALIANALSALVIIIVGTAQGGFGGFVGGLIAAVIELVLGSILIRVYCELLILAFKIYDELKAIRTGTPPPDSQQGFPVEPMPTTPGAIPPSSGTVA